MKILISQKTIYLISTTEKLLHCPYIFFIAVFIPGNFIFSKLSIRRIRRETHEIIIIHYPYV